MAHILVCGQRDIESALFRRRQQIAITQRIPSLLRSSADNMLIEISADRQGRCLIEKNPHLGGIFWQSIETANGKFDNGLDLFSVKRGIPLHDVVDVGASFKILKDGRYRHPRALQDPGAAHLAGNAFHDGTL